MPCLQDVSVVFLRSYIPARCMHTFIPALVHQLNHHINLIHSSTIEVLPHIRRELILAHPPLIFPPSHRRRLPPNPRVDQQRLIKRRCESSRRRQVMRHPVCVQQRQRTRAPRHLYVRQLSIPCFIHARMRREGNPTYTRSIPPSSLSTSRRQLFQRQTAIVFRCRRRRSSVLFALPRMRRRSDLSLSYG